MSEKHVVVEGTLAEIAEKLAETQPEETAASNEEQTETTETPAAVETPAETAPATPAEPAQVDRFKILSDTLGQPFTTDEEIATWRSTITEKLSKFEDLQRQYELAQAELKSYDIRKHFASDEDFIVNQLKIKYPDRDPQIMSMALTTDLTTVDPVRLAAWKELMNDPKREVFTSEDQAYRVICKRYGYDPEIPMAEQDDDVQAAVRLAARDARNEFGKLKSEVEVPKPIDLTAKQAEQEQAAAARYNTLKPLVERDFQSVTAGLDKIDITINKDGKTQTLFTFDLGDYKNSKLVKDTLNEAVEFTARNAREWTPELARQAVEATIADLRKEYLAKNIGRIIEAHGDEVRKKLMDEKFDKENNSRPLNPDVTNPAMTEEQQKLKSVKDKFKQAHGLTGRKVYAP